jgi:hypothetical protein
MARKQPEIITPGGRVIFIRAPKRLSAEQLVMALGSMADDDPRWIAINQVLDEELAAAALDVTNPDTPDTKMRHASGRMDALAALKQRLVDERRKVVAPAKKTHRS